MDFRLIHPDELHSVWPRVKESLTKVRAKADVRWLDEDVYHAIKSGASALHFALSEGMFAGMMVTRVLRCEFSNTPELHVWIAHNVGGANAIESGLQLLREMAANAGAKRLTFDSPRLGWSKRFKLESATYGVDL